MSQFSAAYKSYKQKKTASAMSEGNLLNLAGQYHDRKNSGTYGYTSLLDRWKDLYKRAVDYYEDDAYTGFFDAYSGTRNKSGYVGDTGTWYSDLESKRAEANKGVNELLAELDQYSRYYNPEAVSYVRDLITKRKSSYDDIMTDAGKFRDHWAQWATEGDYNNAVLESDFAKLVQDGKYDEAANKLEELKWSSTDTEKMEQYKAYLDQEKNRSQYKSYDVDHGQNEIDEMRERIAALEGNLGFWDKLSVAATELGMGIFKNEDAMELDGEIQSLKTELAKKEKHHKRMTQGKALVSAEENAINSDDFEVYASRGVSMDNPSPSTWIKEDSIANIVTYSRANANLIRGNAAEYADVAGDSKYAQMSENEVKIYSYYLAKYGKEKAQEYLDMIDADLIQREKDYLNGLNYQFAQKHPILGSLGSVISSLGSAVEYVGDGAKYLVDSTIDPYRAEMDENSLAETTNTVRGAVTDKYDLNILGWDAHDFLYNTLMSGVDSLAASAVPGGGVVLGLSAAAQGTNDALERGLSSDQAFITGAMQGVFEGVFESVSIGQFKTLQEAVVGGGKDIALNIAKSMLVNASEEACTEMANILFDTMVNGALANYTWEELENGAWGDAMMQVAEAAASGALMGFGFGGIGSAVGYKSTRAEGANYKADPSGLINNALGLNPESKYAQELQSKLDSGKKVGQGALGKLSFEMQDSARTQLSERDATTKKQFRTDTLTRIETRLSGKISDKSVLSSISKSVTKALVGENVSNAELRKIAQNQAALNAIRDELGLKKSLKAGEVTVSDLRNAISSRQDSAARLSSANVLATYAAHFNMDEIAERSLMVSYANDVKNAGERGVVAPEVYAEAYNKAYVAGKKGTEISEISGKVSSVLSDSAIAQAYRAGEMVVQSTKSTNSTTNIANKEAQNGQQQEGVRLRDGGERNDGENSRGQVSDVEGNARQNKGRGEGRTGSRDSEASSLSYDREVSAKELVKGGLESSKVWLPTEGSETESMKEARKIAESRGLKVVFFGGGNLKVLEGTKIISARAYIQGDTVYVRVDHAGFAADQLMKHEAAHDMIDKGEINVADVKKLISERFTPEEIDAVINSYAIAYEKAGMTADEIWEEVICDSVAEMNSFEGTDFTTAAEMAADFLPDLKEAVLESKKESRGPPKSSEGKASIEMDVESTDYKINTSMTMAEAKRMIETAYKVHGIAEYYEGEYKDAEDWLKKAGSSEVEMYIENDYDLQAKYINSNDDILNEEYTIRDVLEAYLAGTLVGKEKPKPKRLDVSQSTKLQDDRFYSPQKIEDAKALFDLANQKAVGKDAGAINRARAEILLFAHNKGAAELLGVTQAELNKKLRGWSGYSTTAKNISERINAGVAEENRWTGIENSAYINKAKVTNEDIERLVASVDGDSKGYERKYIARVMLAADTHIDYSGLKFKFASSQQVNADNRSGGRVLGFYDDTNRQIEVTHDKPHTVAHEMGHYIDAQWGRDLIGSSSSHLFLTRGVNSDMVRDRYGEPGVQFLNNFKLFVNSLSDVNQAYNSYYNDRKEIFARFFARFVEWTDNIATGNKYYSYESTMYGDKFTQAQYIEFARLLQEKALLDGMVSNSREDLSEPREPAKAEIMRSIKYANGNAVVWIEDDVLKGNKLPVHQAVANYLVHHIGDVYTIIESGQKVYLGKNLPSEYTQSEYTKKLLKKPGILKAKNKALPNLGEMIEIATNRRWAKDKGSGKKDAKYGVYKYDTRFAFPVLDSKGNKVRAKAYDATLVIINSSDGKKYLYDLVTIKENTSVSVELSARESIPAQEQVQKESVSTISIPQKSDLSTPDAKKVSKGDGHASLDLNEMAGDSDSKTETRELSSREILTNMLESVAETDRDKSILNRYKDHLSKIENNRAEIERLKEERRKAEKAKQKKAISQKIEKLQSEIDYSEKRLITLEDTATLKYLVSKERKARQAEAHLAGQMAQGRRDAEILRHANEKLAEQKTAYGEKLAEQRKSAREALEDQAKRYQESRAKSVEGRRKTDMKHKIQRVVAELDTLLRKGNKKSNVKLGLQDAVAASLEAFDINSDKAERYAQEIARLDAKIAAATDPDVIAGLIDRREKKRRNNEVLADKLTAMKQAYEDIHNNNDEGENYPAYYRAEAKTIMDRISDTLAKVGDTPISEMSSAQLQSVYDMYRMVLTTVRDANTAFIDGKLEDLTENAVAMENDLNKIKKLPEERLRAGDNARGFVWNELTPYYAFKRIGSQTLMRYYDELVRGQDVYARDLDKAKQFAEDARKKYKANKWNRNEIKTFKDKDGRTFRLNLEQMMSIYAYSKREQALDHMERGGFFYNNKETFRKDKNTGILEFIASNESGYKVNSAVLAKIAATLTTEQRAYVDEMQAYLTAMGEKGNEVSRQMWGIDIFKEKVYFPLKSKEDFIYQANTPAETSSLKNDGMTKETKPHASNPIVLESFDEVWANHVEKMSKYHGFVIPIDNLNKIINYGSWIDGEAQSISTMLEARYSSAVNDYLTTFIKDLNGAKNQNGGLLGVASNWLTKFKKTAVAASLSVVVQQPTAILRATSEIDARYFMHLPKAEKLSAKWERIQKYAPIAIIKDIGGFDAGSGRQITEWLNADTRQGVTKAMNKLDDLTMYGAALGDRAGWGAIWTAVEREVQVKQNLKYGTEEFWQACGERFTEVIVKTQVYDSTLSRSGFMRGKDGLLKMATAFMGEPTLSVNMLADAILQGKRGTMKKRQVVRTVAAVYTATIAASLIKSLIYALRDDDEDESYAEKYLQAFGGTILNDVNPLSMLPIFRDVVSILDGWEVERTDMAIVQDLYNAITALDSENKTTWRKFEDLAGALGALAGVPAKNLLRTAREVYNAINDIFDGIEGRDLGGAFVEGITGKEKTKAQTLYEALIGGEAERISALRDDYESEKEYMAAVRAALRKCDPRIKKAAQAYLEGDLATRNEILQEIVDEGVFDTETIDRAIDAELQAIKPEDGQSESDSKWDSVYSPSDIPLAFDHCSDELALEIIAELSEIKIEEKVAAAKAKAEAKGEKFDEDEAREDAEDSVRSTLRSSLTKHYKPLYQAAYASGDRDEMNRIKNVLKTSGLYVFKTKKTIDDVLEEWIEE